MSTGFLKGRLLDVRPDRLDLRDREYRPPLVSLPSECPAREVATQLLPRYLETGLLLDQGQEGACTGFGLAAVINYLLWTKSLGGNGEPSETGRIDPVSPRMLYHLARVYDEWPGEDYEGSSCRGAMKGWHRHGVCSERLWPYRVKASVRFRPPKEGWAEDAAGRTLGAYYRINKASVNDMQAAIQEVGAIYVSARVHAGWTLRASKTQLPIIALKPKNLGGHAFALVGYDRDGFIVQNSWGDRWGYCGFAVLTYEDWVQNGMDAWVAVLGAPVKVKQRIAAYSSKSLRDVADGKASWWWRGESTEIPYAYRNVEVEPWSESEAYHHSVVLGNDGRPLSRIVHLENAEQSVKWVAYDRPLDWMKSNKVKKLLVYAHGGLNDEDASLARIRIMAPYFRANGVYPLYLTWRTGFLESIKGIIADSVNRMFRPPRAEGWISDAIESVKEHLTEAKDRAVEAACEKILVKAVWTQMKQNAEASVDRNAGGFLVAGHLARLAKKIPGLEIHFVGHSAGSIILGHLLSRMTSAKGGIRSVTLYAPACTLEFALEHYKKAIDRQVLRKEHTFVEILSDDRERADSVGPYGKSLLYLVSRALEEVHKTPLLGMEAAWNPDSAPKLRWGEEERKVVDAWREFAANKIDLTMTRTESVSDGRGDIPSAHGAFDNDVKVVTRTLKRILGVDRLRFPIENLRGF